MYLMFYVCVVIYDMTGNFKMFLVFELATPTPLGTSSSKGVSVDIDVAG
jgi:hypothetical protein